MKKLILFLAICAIPAFYYFLPSKDKSSKDLVIAVFPVTVDAFVQFQDEASKIFAENNVEFKALSAEGDATRFLSILDVAIRQKPDILITIGTQLTNIALGPRYKSFDNPIIASCISDPPKVEELVNIGINPRRDRNVAIVSDMPRADAYQLSAEAMQAAIKDLNKVGILYNTSEINSENTALKTAEPLKKRGIEILEGIVTNEEDVLRITSKLIRDGAQILVIPHDKYVIKRAAAISKFGREANPPVAVFALDSGTVRRDDAAFGVSVDYGEIGKITAQHTLGILRKVITAEDSAVIQEDRARVVINKVAWRAANLISLESESIQSLNPLFVK